MIWALALFASTGACGDDDAPSEPDAALAGKDGGGSGGVGGPKGGTGGSIVVDPPPRDSGRPRTCVAIAEEASQVIDASQDCAECLCDMNPTATSMCTSDCWKLAVCTAAIGCALSDAECIRAACLPVLGSVDRYMAAAAQAIVTPFAQCVSDCFHGDDGGS